MQETIEGALEKRAKETGPSLAPVPIIDCVNVEVGYDRFRENYPPTRI